MVEEYLSGPDQILPADDVATTRIDRPVRLRIPKTGPAIETSLPISVPGLLKQTAEEYPDNPALAYKADGKWIKINYKEYLEQARICAKGFLKLGLERYHAVCILGFNSPEWFISYFGAIFAGGVAVGIYLTNSSEACFNCASSSRANIIVVQNQAQLDKILAIKSRLPKLKAIIQYEGKPTTPGVISWSELMARGEEEDDKKLDYILKRMGVNECCVIVFTSGTTGQPKAVMISHDNLTFAALGTSHRTKTYKGDEVFVSYLPPSHVAAQAMDIYFALRTAACVYFADSNALKGTLINTLREAQPTIQLGVPRVWEKIYERMVQVETQSGLFKKALISWAKNQALHHHLNRLKGVDDKGWGYSLANILVFKKIKQTLGLSRCHVYASASAPLSSDIKRYFLSMDIQIRDGYGLSEVSGIHALCGLHTFGLETVGMQVPGVHSKIINPEDGHGELCIYGRHVAMGYLNNKEATDQAVDSEGWFHSGDLGWIDEKGYIYITGRLKELIITSGGENVAQVPIEQLVKNELPYISNAFLVGDKRKFLSILLTFKTEIDPETNKPLDTLLSSVQEWLGSLGCPAESVTELLQAGPDPRLLEALKDGIDRVNQKAISNAQRIQKLSILPVDFSLATGELGPTMKVKRNVVVEKYADIINKMYV